MTVTFLAITYAPLIDDHGYSCCCASSSETNKMLTANVAAKERGPNLVKKKTQQKITLFGNVLACPTFGSFVFLAEFPVFI